MICLILSVLILWLLTGCMVDQHPEDARTTAVETVETMLTITDPVEKAAVEKAKSEVRAMDAEPRIVATSPSVAEICDRLELPLVGVCASTISELPKRYADVTTVGTAMSPDMEIVSSLNPDWILSPSSLQTDLEPKYESLATDWAFLNLRSVQGMYRSIQELGEIFDREEQAQTMMEEFQDFYEEYKSQNEGKAHPKVILRAAHALPDQVVEMFKEDFETNDIWKHFSAVQNGRVYDLTYEYFGMSANFYYPEALKELQPMLYPDSAAGAGTAGNSASGDNASGAASDDKKEGATS